ncbi:carboxysome shell carbonic anhydrase [Ectothiorhodospira haloalkaliphila]|uniref:carboxysome shell carbonic anhydrase n=1 Tax=Ectothiorhodospira haloalkaliphila TaxID=421628 RepID=UPI001EE8427A|nr:carboxysome shell carbonic anhydrase [Ectothiorhodospira haloalkaliphila]MCG5525094.1 carboxysome shell carbonic anhydrase [Ectothiorhodospira haloalkaliphila]
MIRRHAHRDNLIWASGAGAAPSPTATVGDARQASPRKPGGWEPAPAAPRTEDTVSRPSVQDTAPLAPSQERRPPHRARRHVPGTVTQPHPLTNRSTNEQLRTYEQGVRAAFDQIVPTLKQISALHCEPDFTQRAQQLAQRELGFELPNGILDDAWIAGLDLRRLYAWSLFETYRRMADDFFARDPLRGRETTAFDEFLQSCGFHLMDITPCADGRLAHAISYVLRLPIGAVRRKSYAGTLFDVEETVEKWVEVEHQRFREGRPNTADTSTRYLKVVMYHFSSLDPEHQGCAAHGSDDGLAARAGLERLHHFRQAIENSFCCGASVALLLIGLDTDTDAIRVHLPDERGEMDLNQSVDAQALYDQTHNLTPEAARQGILEAVCAAAPDTADEGMVRLVARLVENNLSQIEYVRTLQGGGYPDAGHAERFMAVGIGFEEIQLRNLTYFAYLHTVEEGAPDLDVGCRIFDGLNVSHGLPIPVVVRFDYHGRVPGARERAVERARRLDRALADRFRVRVQQGLLHRMLVVRDCDAGSGLEVVSTSVDPQPAGGH